MYVCSAVLCNYSVVTHSRMHRSDSQEKLTADKLLLDLLVCILDVWSNDMYLRGCLTTRDLLPLRLKGAFPPRYSA